LLAVTEQSIASDVIQITEADVGTTLQALLDKAGTNTICAP